MAQNFLHLLFIVIMLLQCSLFTTADCDHGRRYPHTGDCEHYYQCYYGTLYEFDCADGLHFDANTEICDLPENANCEIEEKCVDDDLLPHADSCELFYKCSEGTLNVLSCPDGLHFNAIAKQCDWPEEAKCAITEENCVDGDLFPHEKSCELFYQCSGASLQLQNCPEGLHFNPTEKHCDWPEEAKCEIIEEKCIDGDLLPHEESCELFYQCSGGGLYLQSCPEGLHFDSIEKICEFPEQAQCDIKEEICVDGDLIPNSEACDLFYLCSQGKLHLIHCPDGLYFNSNEKRCDFPENVVCELN